MKQRDDRPWDDRPWDDPNRRQRAARKIQRLFQALARLVN
ncbi:hypothetical protein E3A20_25700 [Planctomyces bekefii]|uniref:Uncharacterized protein n=1 Tax=Planctomyces bekefii TaxID=1653850 RepID=A0A5C6M5M2_9PLAN|nr:hypothetical protein E3A20_25700 [Planctomyces bekefii]